MTLVGSLVLRYLRDLGVVVDHVAVKDGKHTSLALVGVQPPDRFPLTFYRDDPADIYLTIDDAAAFPFSRHAGDSPLGRRLQPRHDRRCHAQDRPEPLPDMTSPCIWISTCGPPSGRIRTGSD